MPDAPLESPPPGSINTHPTHWPPHCTHSTRCTARYSAGDVRPPTAGWLLPPRAALPATTSGPARPAPCRAAPNTWTCTVCMCVCGVWCTCTVCLVGTLLLRAVTPQSVQGWETLRQKTGWGNQVSNKPPGWVLLEGEYQPRYLSHVRGPSQALRRCLAL